MHVLVTGSRKWKDIVLLREGLVRAVRSTGNNVVIRTGAITLVNGGAPGADKLAQIAARDFGWQIATYEADWSVGPKAGPLRNQRMLDEEQPIVCASFIIPELPCRGTRDMMERCYVAGVPVYVTPGAWHR